MACRSLLILALAAVLTPGLVHAQKGPDADGAPAATTVPSDPHAVADRLLATGPGGAATYFTNVTPSGGPPTLRHRRSGLICVFDGTVASGQVVVYPATAQTNAGDDVSCNQLSGERRSYLETLYVTRYGGGSLETHFAGAVAEIRSRFGALSPWRPAAADAADPALPAVNTARYRVTMDGRATYTRISMTQVGDWTVMMRFSAPLAEAEAADRAASELFRRAVLQIIRSST